MTDQVRIIAIQRAIKQLSIMGAKLRIEYEGEVLHDDLPKVEKKSDRAPRRDLNKLIGHVQVLNVLQPGDSVKFDIPEGWTSGEVQSTVCAGAVQRWGKGAYMTHKNAAGQIELLRME